MGARALVGSATFARAHQPRDDRRRARPTTPAPRAPLPRAAPSTPPRVTAARHATRHATPTQTSTLPRHSAPPPRPP